MNTKERAQEIYNRHLALASVDGRAFRKTVMDEIMATIGCTLAASATYYNNCKKAAPIDGLGRPAVNKAVRKPGGKGKMVMIPDNECFTVIELVNKELDVIVGRCQSFEFQGEASELFDEKTAAWPNSTWVMIQGLGPNHGNNFKLEHGEKEIKRHEPIDHTVA